MVFVTFLSAIEKYLSYVPQTVNSRQGESEENGGSQMSVFCTADCLLKIAYGQ